jgi:hypothetical protein
MMPSTGSHRLTELSTSKNDIFDITSAYLSRRRSQNCQFFGMRVSSILCGDRFLQSARALRLWFTNKRKPFRSFVLFYPQMPLWTRFVQH